MFDICLTMLIETCDFNGAEKILGGGLKTEYQQLESCLTALPLQLKASDQAGKQGTAIFDPVGTNASIETALTKLGFVSKHPVSDEFSFLGTDVDFVKNGLLVEIQFSNYPFLLNNLLRSELFFKAKTPMPSSPMSAVIIVTKAHMFDASNSTLYFEQARNQLSALAKNAVFDVPMRLVGLFAPKNEPFVAKFNEYHNPRYSRTLVKGEERQAIARPGPRDGSRCVIEFLK